MPTLQMILTSALPNISANVELLPVSSGEHWEKLHTLVQQDHLKGARTRGAQLDAVITAGIVQGYKKKAGACQFFLAVPDGAPCAGSGINSPNGMGMVEDLFTMTIVRRAGERSVTRQ